MFYAKVLTIACIAAFLCFLSIGANKCNKLTRFQCPNEESCFPKSWLCDGEPDCRDGSDEKNCKEKKCASDEFRCKNKRCIPDVQKCDSIDHCGDNSDEDRCFLPCNIPEAFKCEASHLCIDKTQLCDKVHDCPMGDDETSSCDVNECLKGNGGCSQKCIDEKIGFKCACRKGYTLGADKKTCYDIDECKDYGVCDQKCQNTEGSYKCLCMDGYKLQSNKKSCAVKGKRPSLIIANHKDISQYSLDGKDSTRLIYGDLIGGTLALDVNQHDGYLYWADYISKTIARAPMNNTKNVVVVANDKLTRAEGIAVDWIGEKLYWTNSGKKSIEVSNTDGSHRKTLFALELDMPRGISLLPAKRLMFWTDWGSSPKIERASMDGSGRKIVIGPEHLKWPNTVTVDQVLNRLYWIDGGKEYIGSSTLDGKDLRKFRLSNTQSSYGLAVFEGFVYWTQTRGAVFAANKFDGKNKRSIRGIYLRTYSITVNHPMTKPKGVNPCGNNNGGCSGLCLLSASNEKGFSCL